jgi:hypothetical protein
MTLFMRLGQLARKLTIRPADVVAALRQGSLPPDSNSNTRLTNEQVKEVVQFFRPGNWSALVQEFLAEDDLGSESSAEQPSPLHLITEPPVNEPPAIGLSTWPSLQPEEKPELIKAPKIELPGLKVVGKIELPEKKHKETIIRQNEEMPQPAPAQRRHRVKSARKQFGNRNKVNPVAAARERQQRELEKQKRLKEERDKERRTKKYLAKVSKYKRIKPLNPASPSTKHVDPVVAPVIHHPATFWGKFKKWLFRD